MAGASSRHKTKLKQSILETFDIYGQLSLWQMQLEKNETTLNQTTIMLFIDSTQKMVKKVFKDNIRLTK